VKRLEPWARASFATTVPKNFAWFHDNVRVILKTPRLSGVRLDALNNEHIADFSSAVSMMVMRCHRQLHHPRDPPRVEAGAEWGVVDSVPTLKLMSGENHREHVVTLTEEKAYLEAADAELAQFMILAFDTGLRPDEAYSLRWEYVNWKNGGNGTVFIAQGKTPAARRVVPMSIRLKFVLETRWELADKLTEGWVWPAPTKSGHFEQSTLSKRHRNALKAAKIDGKSIRPFVIYSARHTFLTRLGESGCDAWTLARSRVTPQSPYPCGTFTHLRKRLRGHEPNGWAQIWAQ